MASKKWLGCTVREAAARRIGWAFDTFEKISVSFSGGKDSTVMLHMVCQEADRRGRRVSILFIDLEAQYSATIEHIERCRALYAHHDWVWVCLPMILRNAVSQYCPRWHCWDPAQRDSWVRPMPSGAVSDASAWAWFRRGMEFEEFVEDYGRELGQAAAVFVGIRTEESLNRWRTIKSTAKQRHSGYGWTTMKDGAATNLYPLYDWRTGDIWRYHAKNPTLPYNGLYDLMHRAGLSPPQMRICQPYGDDQRKGLWLYHVLEPQTWARVVARVAGANFGGRYAAETGSAFGRLRVELPPGHTWWSYCRMLLDSMPPATRAHFETKIDVFLRWYETRGFPDGIPDESPGPLEAARRVPSWRRVAKTLVKLDWWCKGLSFSQTHSAKYDRYIDMRRNEKISRSSLWEK